MVGGAAIPDRVWAAAGEWVSTSRLKAIKSKPHKIALMPRIEV
jgi:hypothetical protein